MRMRGDSDANAVAIVVRDQGVGLRPGEEKLVFNRFWRSDPSRMRRSGGTGLGLSISVEDANLHEGKLEAWGEIGVGASFRLTLPLVRSKKLGVSPLPLEPAKSRSGITPEQIALDIGTVDATDHTDSTPTEFELAAADPIDPATGEPYELATAEPYEQPVASPTAELETAPAASESENGDGAQTVLPLPSGRTPPDSPDDTVLADQGDGKP